MIGTKVRDVFPTPTGETVAAAAPFLTYESSLIVRMKNTFRSQSKKCTRDFFTVNALAQALPAAPRSRPRSPKSDDLLL